MAYGLWGRLLRACNDWYARRRTLGELQRLDDRMLRDIGLVRDELDGAVAACVRSQTGVGERPRPRVPASLSAVAAAPTPASSQDNRRSGIQPAA